MKALSRSAACALGVRALLVLPASPLFPLPASGFQADDKSFSLAVPPAWQLDPAPPRVAQPDSVLFRVVGSDAAGGRFEATVEPSPKKQLGELGSLDAVAQRYLALQPQPAALLGATTVPRPNMRHWRADQKRLPRLDRSWSQNGYGWWWCDDDDAFSVFLL